MINYNINKSATIACVIVLGFLLASPAYASDRQRIQGDDTMTALGANEIPENIDRIILLPENASEIAVIRTTRGLETASQSQEKGREFGMERSREAREGGVGNHIRDLNTPSNRPDNPGRPVLAGRSDIHNMPGRTDLAARTERPDRMEVPQRSQAPARPEMPVRGVSERLMGDR